MKKEIVLVIGILTFSSLDTCLFGQSGTLTAVNTDTRTLSMGETTVASEASAFSIFNNGSAAVMSPDKMNFGVSYAQWQPDMLNATIITGAGYFKMSEKSALSFGIRKFGYQDINVTDINGNDDGTFTPSELSIGIGLAYKIKSRLSVSLNFNYFSSDMDGESKGSAFYADLGMTYQTGKYKLGLNVSDIGSKLDYGNGTYSLPANAQIGAGYSSKIGGKDKFNANIQIGCTLENTSVIAGAGVEYVLRDIVALRAGAHYGDKAKGIPPYTSIGIGLKLSSINLDFAYLLTSSDSPLKNSLSIGIGYRL